MKKTLLLLFLLPLALLGAPQAITKDGGALTAPFTVPTGTSISATGTGTITATSVSGSTPSSSSAFNATGTGGGGYFQGLNQASAPSTPTTAGRLFWDSSNYASFIGTSGFGGKLNFTGNSAFRVYTFPDYAATLATLAGTETLTNKSIDASQLTGTIAAGRMPALTGDVTTSSGSVATTLAIVNSNVGTFGSATKSVTLTFDGKGRATAAAEQTVTPAVGSITGLGTAVATALGVNVGSAGAVVVNGGALGTPSSGVGTNLTATKASQATGDSYSVTFTGTLRQPIILLPFAAGVIIPYGSTSGTTYNGTSGISVNLLNYQEGLSNTGNRLTTLSFPGIVFVSNFNVTTCTALTSLATDDAHVILTYNPGNLPALTTLSASSMTICGAGFTPNTMAALTSLSFPNLVDVVGGFTPNTMASLTTWNFSGLLRVGNTFGPNAMGALTSLSCNALQVSGGNFSLANMASLTTASFSAMVNYGGTITMSTGVGSLSSLTLGTIGTLHAIDGATVTIAGALSQTSVDNCLKLLASLDGTGGTTSFGTGKTVTLSGGTNASPSTTGTTATTPAGSSFVGVGTTCTATITSHGLSSGDIITTTGIATLTNANVTAATVTVLNANQFTYAIVSQTATGTGTASMHSTPAAGTDGFHACQVIRLRGATVTTALGF